MVSVAAINFTQTGSEREQSSKQKGKGKTEREKEREREALGSSLASLSIHSSLLPLMSQCLLSPLGLALVQSQ